MLATASAVMVAMSVACMNAGGAQPEVDPSPTPTSVAAREILAAAAKAMDALQSGSLKWETTTSGGGDPAEVVRIDFDVDFIVGDRYTSVSTIDGGGMEFESTSIQIGRDNYRQNLLTGTDGEWEHYRDDSCNAIQRWEFGVLNLHLEEDSTESISLEGVKEMDGEQVYHLRGQAPFGVVDFILGTGSAMEDSEFPPSDIELWIGVDDSLMRKLSVQSEYVDPESGTEGSSALTITLSDFNEPLDIQPPAPELVDTETGQWMATLAGDDHGNSPRDAYARLLAGKADEGSIETGADLDVFTFNATEGRRYVLEVTLCTLTGAVLRIIDAQSNLLAEDGGPTNSKAPRIEWTAPSSGDYYASVKGAGGATGSYRLSILELDEQQQP